MQKLYTVKTGVNQHLGVENACSMHEVYCMHAHAVPVLSQYYDQDTMDHNIQCVGSGITPACMVKFSKH